MSIQKGKEGFSPVSMDGLKVMEDIVCFLNKSFRTGGEKLIICNGSLDYGVKIG